MLIACKNRIVPSLRNYSIRIYTKTGDKGTTSLFTGTRKAKNDPVFEALGNVDELNAAIGICREYTKSVTQVDEQLQIIQSRLLDIGSAIATPLDDIKNNSEKLERVAFDEVNVSRLENWIDSMDEQLEPLKNFILPSGGLAASHLHLARTICRRSERSVVELVSEGHTPRVVQIYLNRLSDYLFVCARFVCKQENHQETIYKKQ